MAKISTLKLGSTTIYPKTITEAIADITGIRDKHILSEILIELDKAIKSNKDILDIITGDITTDNSISKLIKTAIETLDYSDTPVDNNFVTKVDQEDGIIKVVRRRPISDDISRTENNGNISGTTVESALVELQGKINESNAAQKSYKIVNALDDVSEDANVQEAWKIQEKIGNGNYGDVDGSSIIKIYKDSALFKVYLGTTKDTVDENTGDYTTPSGTTDPQSLNFIYRLSNGKYTLAPIDISKFLTQSEFKDGLKVSDGGEVSVKLDDLEGSDSKKFLRLVERHQGENQSIALSGITEAIETEYVEGHDTDVKKNASGKTQIDVSLDENVKVLGVSFGGIKNGETILKGTSLTNILKKLLILVKERTIVLPTTELTGSSTQTLEVGDTYSATLGHIYKDGSFNGNPDDGFDPTTISAGCTEGVTNYNVGGSKQTNTSVSFPVTEGNKNIGCETAYGASISTNLKNNGDTDTKNIPSGTATSTTTYTITGKYKFYVGYTEATDPSQINTTALIQGLNTFDGYITPETTKQQIGSETTSNGTSIVIALPEKYKLKTINNSIGASILSNFKSNENGGTGKEGTCKYTNGTTKTDYHIYMYDITSGTRITYKDITIGK